MARRQKAGRTAGVAEAGRDQRRLARCLRWIARWRLNTLLLLLVAWSAEAPSLWTEDEVVVVRTSSAAPYVQAAERLQQDLTSKGHAVRIMDLEMLKTDDNAKLTELLALPRVKAFAAVGSGAAQWLQGKVPQTMGLCYCMVANPIEAGLTAGRKSYGVTTTVALEDQLTLMQEALPGLKRIGTLYSKKDPDSKAGWEALKGHLGDRFELVSVAVEDYDSVSEAIQGLIAQKPEVIWTAPDTAVFSSATVRSLLLLALRNKLPVFGFSASFVRAGALVGVGVEPAEQGAQCGQLVDAWLRAIQAKTEEAFLKQPRVVNPRFQVAINQIVAKQLDKSIPETVTKRAEVVYQE